MFLKKDKEEPVDRRRHYANAARRFAMDAKMFRCRAAIHVENKDDIAFWGTVLKHFRPQDRFHFIAGSRNEYGNETCGVTQCLKYYDSLSPDFFICIDSDYRYLLRTEGMDVDHYVLQTYTYSFENHHCFADGLNDVCCRITQLKNDIFDFRRFMKRYSNILYDLFVWHLYFQNADPVRFSQMEFDGYLSLCNFRTCPVTRDNGERALDELKQRVDAKTGFLGRQYPQADLETVKERYREMGVTPDNVYLFVRGHNLYDLVTMVCKEVCKAMLRAARSRHRISREMVSELYRRRNRLDEELKQNIKYGAYPPICRIAEDVGKLLGE